MSEPSRPETVETPSETLRQRWLAALLPLVPEQGWTEAAARAAAEAAGLTAGEQALAAPQGVTELMAAFFDGADRRAEAALAATDLSAMRTPERVGAGVKAWLMELELHREAVRRAAGQGLLPGRAGAAAARTWGVADWVWRAAGDTATDYNRYSKRALLAAVLPGLVFFWLKAPSEAELDAEIARRLTFASETGRSLAKLAGPLLRKRDTQTPRAGGFGV